MSEPTPIDERQVAECARMLTASLTEPALFPVEEMLNRIERQTADNEPMGRRWITAVHRVRAAGHLTRDQEHALLQTIGYSILGESYVRDPEMSDLTRRVAELHDSLEGQELEEHKKGRGATNKEINRLLIQRSERHENLLIAFYRGIGEEEFAHRIESERRAFRVNALEAMKELWAKDYLEETGWKVAYPSPDAPLPEPAAGGVPAPDTPRGERPDELEDELVAGDDDELAVEAEDAGGTSDQAHDTQGDGAEFEEDPGDDEENVDDETRLAGYVERWREATSGGGIWTVEAVLAFAFIESMDNEDGMGDLWVQSIQAAREMGAVDKNLSYLLLNRVTDAMIPDGPGADAVLLQLEEQMEEIPYIEPASGEPEDPQWDPRDREKWKAVSAAYHRRRELLRRALLARAGEQQMVRLMEERPAEFKMRTATAATEWGVDD
ncbi:MAG: hypothetical protein ACHQQ3_05480 [Gemmatimonadales bacterium]